MFKKYLAVFVLLLAVFALVACGAPAQAPTEEAPAEEEMAEEPTEEPAEEEMAEEPTEEMAKSQPKKRWPKKK